MKSTIPRKRPLTCGKSVFAGEGDSSEPRSSLQGSRWVWNCRCQRRLIADLVGQAASSERVGPLRPHGGEVCSSTVASGSRLHSLRGGNRGGWDRSAGAGRGELLLWLNKLDPALKT